MVYSLAGDRVWLVGDNGKVARTYTVVPGTVDPAKGTYTVTSRTKAGTGATGWPSSTSCASRPPAV